MLLRGGYNCCVICFSRNNSEYSFNKKYNRPIKEDEEKLMKYLDILVYKCNLC